MRLIEDEKCECPIEFYFPAAVYEKGAEKKTLPVDLLKRNITGLSENDVMFVGNYRNDGERSGG